jgi:Ino eighty subunit 2
MPRLRARPAPNPPPSAPAASSTRPRRGTASRSDAPSAVIQRSSPEETRQSLSLTVKSSPNKLRQATGAPAVSKGNLSRSNIVSGKRASRSSRVVREIDSEEDEEEDEEAEDEADEVDAMDVDDEEDEEDDVDAEGSEEEDMDAEGDEEEDDEPLVVPTHKAIPVAAKPKVSITKAQDAVEAKEMAMSDDDDDELSDPDSDLDDMEDAEGEDDDAEGEEDDELGGPEGDVDMDSDEDMSRDETPDVTKLTRRQRAVLEQEEDGSLLALSNEAQKKKHLTAEEHAMRRAEMARRRKNLSEKRNEEEKVCFGNQCLYNFALANLLSSTPSTVFSRSSLQSVAVRAPLISMSLVKKSSLSQNDQTHSSCATFRTLRAQNSLCQMSGCRLRSARCSQARLSLQTRRRGVAGWSRRSRRAATSMTYEVAGRGVDTTLARSARGTTPSAEDLCVFC